MNRKQLLAMWATILLLALTWVFPPVLETHYDAHSRPYLVPVLGFSLDSEIIDVDWQRLLLLDGVILLLGTGIFITLRTK